MSPIWLTSKMPTPLRTARGSAMRPPCLGYSTGISHPLKSTILAPIWRWTALRAVLRGAAVSTTDDTEGPRDWKFQRINYKRARLTLDLRRVNAGQEGKWKCTSCLEAMG